MPPDESRVSDLICAGEAVPTLKDWQTGLADSIRGENMVFPIEGERGGYLGAVKVMYYLQERRSGLR